MKEPLLEPLLRTMRLRKMLPYLKRYPDCVFLDVGCGWGAELLKSVEPHIKKGIGVDFKAPALISDKLETLSLKLDKELPFADKSFDIVTLMAVLEHLDQPEFIISEIDRVLRPGGVLLLTVPSWYAKPVLEFLSFKLGIVNRDEILDHKRYYNKSDLFKLFALTKSLKITRHCYFQGPFNNFVCASKLG